MSDSIVPESRIFRIGRECYVVYLGKERDDIRPFLRIGNMRDIPDEVHDALSTTVVTDDHVGNPLLEILIAPKFHGRYLGDTNVVAAIRRFFKSFDLPTDDVTDYRKVKDGERRHMIWFYSSGNIHLRYDDQVIFDLDKREKEDRHFVRLYEEAKGEFLRNPLRYIRQDFSGQGVVLCETNAFWYEAGDLCSFASHPGFVAQLMVDGVDPDFINASAYNLTPEVMDSHDAAVYIGFVKRTRQRRKQLRVITSSPELQRKLKLLFPERGDVPVTLDVTDVSGTRKATFRDSIVSRKEDQWHLHRAGLPEISFGGNPDVGVAIDADKGLIKLNSENKSISFTPPRGFPIEFIGHEAPDYQLMDKYVGFTLSNVKDHLSDSEAQAVAVLERYLKMLKDDISAKKSAVSPLLKQVAGNARDSLKRCSGVEGGPSWFFFSNARSLLELFISRLEENHSLAKSAETMSGALKALLGRLPVPDPILPFWGDLYLGDNPCLLWRASKRGFVSADILATREVNSNIVSIASLNETPWHDDLERLLKLIRSLGQGGQGPLTDEQLALLASPETEKAAAENKPKESTEPQRSKPSERMEKPAEIFDASAGSKKPVSDKKKSSGGSRRKWPWILLVLLLLLLGGALAWDLSGSAPWGSVFSQTDRTRAGESGETSDDGTVGTDPSATDSGDTVVTDSGTDSTDGSGTATADSSGSTESGDSTGKTDSAGTTDSTDTDEANIATGSADTGAKDSIDTDVAPRTFDEVKAYLDVDGRVAITEVDIHLAANEIAVLNGYKDLDYKVYTGEDPDWIYPGKILKLPGSGDYVINRGDTIWFLAAREVRIDVEENLVIFDKALSILDNSSSDTDNRAKSAESLRKISRDSKAAVLRNMALNALTERQL